MKKSLTAAAVLLPAGALALASWKYVVHPGSDHQVMAARAAPASDTPAQLWTCGMHPQVVQDHPGTCPICHMRLTPMHSATGHDHGGAGVVVIDAAVVQNMGVRTAEVTRGPVVESVRTVGTLEAPETGLHDVSLRVGGWIEKLYANQEGQHVHAGEPLLELYSPDLIAAGGELVGAVRAVRALGPTADESVRRSAEEMVRSAERKLSLLDVPDGQVRSIAQSLVVPTTITFRSPASGAVIDKGVVEGSSVAAGQKLMRIEDHSALWLDLAVYEDQMSLVAVGQGVDATVEGLPGRTYHGTVTFVHPHVDPMSRTVTARATLDNLDGSLRPGMYASAAILTRPVEDAVQVPREAVIDTGIRQVAFVALAGGHFEPRDVRMGVGGDDGRVQIVSGLSPGETVVTSGQFLLDVESRTTEAIEKLRSGSETASRFQGGAVAAGSEGVAGDPGLREYPQTPAWPVAKREVDPGPLVRSDTERPMPATGSARLLTVAYCPMKKAPWLQEGDTISNPYFGTSMSDCGEVRGHVRAPAASSAVGAVADAYLRVEKGLAADRLDADAGAALRAAGERLDDPSQESLRAAALDVASATDLTAARSALKTLSEALVRATDTVAGTATPLSGGRP